MAIFLFLLFHLSHPLLCLNLLDNLFLSYFQHYLQCLKNVDLIIKKKRVIASIQAVLVEGIVKHLKGGKDSMLGRLSMRKGTLATVE